MADPDAEKNIKNIEFKIKYVYWNFEIILYNYFINLKLPVTVAAGVVGKTLFLPLAVDTTSCCDDPGVWCGCVDAI